MICAAKKGNENVITHTVIADTKNAPNNAWTNNWEKMKLNTSHYGDCYFWPIVVVLFNCVIVGTGTPAVMALPDWTVYLLCFASVCGGVYVCRVFKCARISAWKKGLMARTEKPLFWIAWVTCLSWCGLFSPQQANLLFFYPHLTLTLPYMMFTWSVLYVLLKYKCFTCVDLAYVYLRERHWSVIS